MAHNNAKIDKKMLKNDENTAEKVQNSQCSIKLSVFGLGPKG